MFIIKPLQRPGILLAAFVAAILGGAQAASAAPGQVVHQDVTGAVFTCNDGSTYTVLSGEAMSLFHESTDKARQRHLPRTRGLRQSAPRSFQWQPGSRRAADTWHQGGARNLAGAPGGPRLAR